MQLNALKYLGRRVPRYTSYPTAVQFESGVDAVLYQEWLASVPADAPVSIYLHVPFCSELCLYCGCHTAVARRHTPVAAFAELLEREITLVGKRLAGQTVTHIHWGGGTPTLLRPNEFVRLTEALRANFTITPTTETAIEIDPRVAKTVGRAQTLHPNRIALFGYAHVPWIKRHQRLIPEDALPDTGERFAQNSAAAELLVDAGYQQIGIDHFARSDDLLAQRQREGRLHRNFQGYTTDETETLIGFGPSAIGSLPGGYVQNSPGMIAYRDAIMADRFATVRGRSLTLEDRLRGHIIERLMCDLRVDIADVCPTHGARLDHFDIEISKLDELAGDGIVERRGTKISVPPEARAFVRTVCAVFDQYAAQDETRYSRAS